MPSTSGPVPYGINGEEITATDEAEIPRPFYRLAEEKPINKVSFMV
jgi:hypothetical protein